VAKAERIATVPLGLVGIVTASAAVFLISSRLLYGVPFGAIAAVLFFVSILRSRGVTEEEMIRGQDEAMKTKDDPNEMNRWVP